MARRGSSVIPIEELADDDRHGFALHDPVTYADVYHGVKLWDGQARIARDVGMYPRVTVKACHSSGKTFLAALLTLWWLLRWPDGKVLTTAPTKNQVRLQLWPEIRTLRNSARIKLPPCQTQALYLSEQRFAVGISTKVDEQDEGVRMQGFHGGHLLIITDESPGIHQKINDAIEGARASGTVHMLRLGNPTIPSGDFYQSFRTLGYRRHTIDAFDTPNLEGVTEDQLAAIAPDKPEPAILDHIRVPHLVTRRWVWERIHEWGTDSPRYQARVRGQFPLQSEHSVFPISWIERAASRDPLFIPGKLAAETVIGCDVAGPGEDETTACARRAGHILSQEAWSDRDARGPFLAYCRRVWEQYGPPLVINIDCIGIGWYFYCDIAQWAMEASGNDGGKIRVNPINVALPSRDPERFRNLRSELHWGLRERMRDNQLSGLADETACNQLGSILYRENSRGQTQIESKEDMAKRGVSSPDRAECVILAFASEAQPLPQGRTVYEDPEPIHISSF